MLNVLHTHTFLFDTDTLSVFLKMTDRNVSSLLSLLNVCSRRCSGGSVHDMRGLDGFFEVRILLLWMNALSLFVFLL